MSPVKHAYHDILLADGTLHRGPVVVETEADGKFLSWYPLEQEEPFTEWVGGTYRMDEPQTPGKRP